MTRAETTADKLPPLVVDLDRTLIRSDMLYESLWKLICRNPLYCFLIPVWLVRGRAHLKQRIAQLTAVDVRLLPYHQELLDYLREERRNDRRLILATASDLSIAERIAAYLGIFDDVIASDGKINLKGTRKAEELARRYGRGSFSYAADGRHDLPIWQTAASALVVSDDQKLLHRIRKTTPIEKVFSGQKVTLRLFVKALRLHQWFKNVLVFVPLIAAHRVSDIATVAETVLAFLAFGLVASAGYLLNDLVDVDVDRRHPSKKDRPFASGALDFRFGFFGSPLLLAMGGGISLLLPGKFQVALFAYFAATQLYSFYLKRLVLVDVFMLAVLYTARIIAGALAIDVPVSQWLLAFSVFLFLSLAFVKRYSELHSLRQRDEELAAGRGYSVVDFELLSSLGAAGGYIAVLVFALYINSPEVRVLYRTPEYLWMFCLVLLYWISRVWIIAHRGRMHDDPIVFALKDRVSYLVGAAGVASFVLASI